MGCSLINSNSNSNFLVTVVANSTVFPSQKSSMPDLKLSVSDLPMLSCHYIQKGALFLLPQIQIHDLPSYLRSGLSKTLSLFPPLAGRFVTDAATGEISISCNDAGADFVLASAESVSVHDLLDSAADTPAVFKEFFYRDGEVSYSGHFRPIISVQVTCLGDGVFIGCSINHAVVDGTSFWNFFNTFGDVCRGVKRMSTQPEFDRINSVLVSSTAVLKVPPGGPAVTFSADDPVRERIFTFSRTALLHLKAKTNAQNDVVETFLENDVVELMAKRSNDPYFANGKNDVVSSFQSMCALIWRCTTRARRLAAGKTTTFRMAVNCRHRMSPSLHPLYFGNAIQSIPTTAAAGDLLSHDLRWCGELLRRSVAAHDDGTVRRNIKAWERDPKCFPLGNFDGAMVTMGSSPRFPMYEGDFGWGKPVAVRSGRANKFDGKMSAFPGRSGGGSVDVEMVLCPETMTALETDAEFLEFVSRY